MSCFNEIIPTSTIPKVSTTNLPEEKRFTQINLDDPKTKAATSGVCYYAKKVAHFVLYGLAYVLHIITAPFRVYSYIYNKELKDGIKEARLQAFKEGLNGSIFLKTTRQKLVVDSFKQWQTFDRTKILEFLIMTWNIKEMIQKNENPDDIRKAIDEAMSTEIYQTSKTTDHPAIELLQILAIKDLTPNGMKTLEAYGKKVSDPVKQKSSWEDLAITLDKSVGTRFAYQRNGLFSMTLWGLTHPLEVVHSMGSSWFPLEYNAHDGNPNIYDGYDFTNPKDSNKKMQFYYGPGPTGDRLYKDGVLPYMDKLNEKRLNVHELRGNFQNTNQSSEIPRIREMEHYQKMHPDSMRLLSISFDTEAMKMGGDFVKFEKASEFIEKYKKHTTGTDGKAHREISPDHKNDNGFFMSDKVIEDGQFEKAFACADKIFTSLSEENAHWGKLIQMGNKGKQRLGRMMQLGVHAIISLGAIYQSLQEISSEKQLDAKLDKDLTASRVSGACKQDIDRAIVENVALRLFFRLLNNDEPLTEEEVYLIVGAVVGRAEMVEGRLTQWKRYEILSDLLRFVGNDANVKTLAKELRAYAAVS